MPLVHDFVPLDEGFEVVTGRLVAEDRDAVAHRLGLDELRDVVARGVGHPRFHDETLVIPLRLKGLDTPFERLDADVRVERVDEEHSHLMLTGSYEADAISRRESVVQQRLVESWVRAFLTRVAGSLSSNGHSPVSR